MQTIEIKIEQIRDISGTIAELENVRISGSVAKLTFRHTRKNIISPSLYQLSCQKILRKILKKKHVNEDELKIV